MHLMPFFQYRLTTLLLAMAGIGLAVFMHLDSGNIVFNMTDEYAQRTFADNPYDQSPNGQLAAEA